MIKNKPALNHYKFSGKQPVIFSAHAHQLIPKPIFDMHLSPEVGVVLKGRMARYVGDIRFELSRGGVWLTGMLEPHGRQALEPNSEVAVFIVSPNFFSDTVGLCEDNSIWQKPFNTPARQRPLLINEEFALIAERLINLINNDSSPVLQSAQIQLALLEIILHANRLGKFKTDRSNIAIEFSRLQPALKLIFDSRHPVNTAKAAQQCKLSSSRFSQLFVQATGQSFREFSLRYRLWQVALELKSSNKLLDELAAKWGFTDKSHLLHRFKEHYNVTPAIYRQD